VSPNCNANSATVGFAFFAILSINLSSFHTSAHIKSLNTLSNFRSTDALPAVWTTNQGRAKQISDAYKSLPLGFEANDGQADPNIKFMSRSPGHNIFLTVTGAAVGSSAPASSTEPNQLSCPVSHPILQITFARQNRAKHIIGLDELPWRSNYLTGGNPKHWRTNVRVYFRIKYESICEGVDAIFYGNQRELEYDFIVAPGADFKTIGVKFQDERGITLDGSGDLLIKSSLGEFRQRKPFIYQQTNGTVHPVAGGYVIREHNEVGFEIGDYDRTQTLVIDPVFAYSTSIGGGGNDTANAVAMDGFGNAYVTGITTSTDFPTINAFQSSLSVGVSVGHSDVFVAKLNPQGTALVYSTYLGGTSSDGAHAIAVDSAGSAYVTGYTLSRDFPTTAGAFQRASSAGGDAFVTKLTPAGNGLSYSTYLGGSLVSEQVPFPNVGRGIAIDDTGHAYVAGYTYSSQFPLKRPAQAQFNKGSAACCDCSTFFPLPRQEDAFVTKLDPSGTQLIYSTFIGGSNADEAYGIAIDSTGSAYVAGGTCSTDLTGVSGDSDALLGAFLVKLNPSGKKFVYAKRLGGRGKELANSVSVDAEGNAYVTGLTDSDDFPTTSSALQTRLGGSVLYQTHDGGGMFRSITGLPNSSVTAVAVDPSNPLRVFAGLNARFSGSGLLTSTDGGETWDNPGIAGFPYPFVWGIAVDPKNSSVIYTELFKSTNGGSSWTFMGFPPGAPFSAPFGPSQILIDPDDSSTLYVLSRGGALGDVLITPHFFKSTNAGITWNPVRRDLNLFTPRSVVLDTKNGANIFAVDGDLYRSTDGGTTWRIPYDEFHSFNTLAIDPNDSSTLYLSDPDGHVFKTTDAGISFSAIASLGLSITALRVDPKNSSIVYATALGPSGGGALLKSVDGGQTWTTTDLVAQAINVVEIDPFNPSHVFAGVDFDTDGFVTKVNSSGSSLVYSTYLGTRSQDVIAAIGVDGISNVYVTGSTFSDRFPTRDAFQTNKPTGLFDSAIFTTTLSSSGSTLSFSTYAGGSDPGTGSGIAVSPSGKFCIAGTTGKFRPLPSARSQIGAQGGFDAFVMRLTSVPRISNVVISGKNLVVSGEGFDVGSLIIVNDVGQPTRYDESLAGRRLIGNKTAKSITVGQQVSVVVRNSDGFQSAAFSFTRTQ